MKDTTYGNIFNKKTSEIYTDLVLFANYYDEAPDKTFLGYIMAELDRRRDDDKRMLYDTLILNMVGPSRKKLEHIDNEKDMLKHIIESNPRFIEDIGKKNPEIKKFCNEYLGKKRRSIKAILAKQYIDALVMRNEFIRYREPTWGNGKVKMPGQIFYKIARMLLKNPDFDYDTHENEEEVRENATISDYMGLRLVWHRPKNMSDEELYNAMDSALQRLTKKYPFRIEEVENSSRGERRKLRLIPTESTSHGHFLDKISMELLTLDELFDLNVIPLRNYEKKGNRTRIKYGEKGRIKIHGKSFMLNNEDERNAWKIVANTLEMLGIDFEREKILSFRYFRHIM